MKIKTIAAAAFLAISTMAFGQDKCKEIIDIFSDLDRVPDYNFSTLQIDNIEKNGKTERLQVKQYGGGDNGLKNVAFDFQSPARVKGIRILQAEKKGKSDDRWIYMPELKQTRRIAMGDRYKAFVGTELTYNDMTIRYYDEDTHEMLDENASIQVGGVTYSAWQMKATPIKKKEVEYAYRISWFDKKTYVPVKIEFYDKNGKCFKTCTCDKLEMVKGATGIEYPLRRQATYKNEVTGRRSVITVKDFEFDKIISNNYFTQNWLNTGKAK